jgi:hypothetical protein
MLPKINVGSTYDVAKEFSNKGGKVKEGTTLYAWYYGELIFLEVGTDGSLDHAKEVCISVKRALSLVEKGVLVERVKPSKEAVN